MKQNKQYRQNKQQKQYRNEWKYICDEAALCVLKERLATVMERDDNSNTDGIYEIHSMYFDDYKDSCARENDAGTASRFKYRLRFYNDDSSVIKLERKEKHYGKCYKESCLITKEQYEKLLTGCVSEVLYETEDKLLKRFCTDMLTRHFTPKAIVDYERTAFVEPVTNVRITIDENISVADDMEGFLTGDYLRYPIQEEKKHVLEVKFDYILPGYIKNMITDGGMVQTAFSKYYLGRLQLQRMMR